MLRILEAFGEPISYGGQETFVMNLVSNMDMSDKTVDFLTPYYCDNRIMEKKMQKLGGTLYSIGCKFNPGGARIREIKHIKKHLSDHKYDLIHIHASNNIMLAIMSKLAYKAGIPRIIVHSHCMGKKGWKHTVSKAITSTALKRYPTDFCACSLEAAEWRFSEKVCREKLLVIKNGIEIDKFRFNHNTRTLYRRLIDVDENVILVGCVGRLTSVKNQILLIEAIYLLKTDNGFHLNDKKYKLVLIGEGEEKKRLQQRVTELNMDDDVLFLGKIDNVSDYLQALDVFALPSKYEGHSIAMIEAQAAGLSVITSDTLPTTTAITENVIFVDIDDVEKWAEVISKSRERNGSQADELVKKGFDIKDVSKTIENLYHCTSVN